MRGVIEQKLLQCTKKVNFFFFVSEWKNRHWCASFQSNVPASLDSDAKVTSLGVIESDSESFLEVINVISKKNNNKICPSFFFFFFPLRARTFKSLRDGQLSSIIDSMEEVCTIRRHFRLHCTSPTVRIEVYMNRSQIRDRVCSCSSYRGQLKEYSSAGSLHLSIKKKKRLNTFNSNEKRTEDHLLKKKIHGNV